MRFSITHAGTKDSGIKKRKMRRRDKVLAHPAFRLLVALNLAGAIYAGWLYFNQEERHAPYGVEFEEKIPQAMVSGQGITASTAKDSLPPGTTGSSVDRPAGKPSIDLPKSGNDVKKEKAHSVPNTDKQAEREHAAIKKSTTSKTQEVYTVTQPRVYFHNEPDKSTRRNAFINQWNKAMLEPLDEENGFVYIVYTNAWGQTSKGWMIKKELTPINK